MKPTSTEANPQKDQFQAQAEIQSYLETLPQSELQTLLQVDVGNLTEFSTSFKGGCEVLTEALEFAKTHHTWKFWACPCCDLKFGDASSHLEHVKNAHVKAILSDESKEKLPKGVSQDWADTLVNSDWKPIDVKALAIIMRVYTSFRLWSLSYDPERTQLLHEIGDYFKMLVDNKCFPARILETLLQYAMREVHAHPHSSVLLKQGVDDQTMDCFRVLDAPKLVPIMEFLEFILMTCELERCSKKGESSANVGVVDDADCRELEMIFLDLESSKLSVDPQTYSNVDTAVSWLYGGPTFEEAFLDWTSARNSKESMRDDIFQKLQKEFDTLKRLCSEKCELDRYMVAFKHLEDICRDEKAEVESYKALMRKQMEEADDEAKHLVFHVIFDVFVKAFDLKQTDSESKAAGSILSKGLKVNNTGDACQMIKGMKNEEQSLVDVKIMHKLKGTRKLELELGSASSSDFLPVVAPLVKAYLKMFIEEDAEHFAKEKSEAAFEAPLAEEQDTSSVDKGDGCRQEAEEPKE